MLKEDIAGTIEPNDERFRELGGRDARLPSRHQWIFGTDVPCPAVVRKSTHPPTQRQQTVPEENAAFNEMRETREYLALLEETTIDHEAGGYGEEAEKQQDILQEDLNEPHERRHPVTGDKSDDT